VAFSQAGGRKIGFLSNDGFAVVNVELKKLETAYTSKEFTDGIRKILKEVEKYGR